jgi:hypothetical protein
MSMDTTVAGDAPRPGTTLVTAGIRVTGVWCEVGAPPEPEPDDAPRHNTQRQGDDD